MSVDRKNNKRIDLNDIYRQVRDRSLLVANANGLDTDRYAISGHEVNMMHRMAMKAMGIIADRSGYLKHYLETPIDSLTYYTEYEAPVDSDGDTVVDGPDQNDDYTASEAYTEFYTYQVTDDNNIFTSNQTLSDLNDSHANLSTGDIAVLQGQTTESENGTYRINAVGEPTKLSDLFTVIQVMTFSSLPDYTLGEVVSDGTNSAKVIGLDSSNEKAVVSLIEGTYFGGTATLTGSTSTESGTATSEDKVVRDTPRTIDTDDISGSTKNSGEKLDRSATPDYIEFYGIDDLDDTNMIRWTTVQEFVVNAIVEGVLYEWFRYVAQFELAAMFRTEFERLVVDHVRYNTARLHKSKESRKTYRIVG